MINLGFLASNNGSSARAIVAAITAGVLDAEARLMVSNRPSAPALDFARAQGVPGLCIPTLPDPAAADARLAHAMRTAGVEWIILCGYLRKLGPLTLRAFEGRILNIHPSLLPRHGGEGMYGRRVHAEVIAAGDTISGASVHLVDGDYDHGKVIAYVEVPVLRTDTAEDVERRVTRAEPGLYIDTLRKISAAQAV